MARALITGAKGFIGRYLAQHLAQRKIKVAGLGHGAWVGNDFSKSGLEYWLNGEISFANLDCIATDIGSPDYIFHLAGGSLVAPSFQLPGEDCHRTVESSSLLLEWVRQNALSSCLVFASSAAVYGAGHVTPIGEGAIPSPYSPYGFHKRMAELLFESYSKNFGLSTSVVRLFSVYGVELRKQLLWDVCNRLSTCPEKLEMAGTGDELRDWLHVTDAAGYLARAAELSDSACFVVNGGTGQAGSVKEVVEWVCELWGNRVTPVFNGHGRPGDPRFLVADASYAKSKGFSSTIDWRHGVAEYVEWFRANIK